MPLYAQRYQISLKSWTSQDGISDRQVNGVYKDSRGFIWLCTRNGLDRFDGYRFTNYTKEKDHFPFTYLAKMTEDAAGNFWILGNAGIDSNNLFIFDPLRKKVRSFMQVTGCRTGFRFNFLEKFNDSTLFFGRMKDTVFFTWHPRTGLQRIRYPVAVNAILTTSGHNTCWVQNNTQELCEIDMQGRLLRKVSTENEVLYKSPNIVTHVVYSPMARQQHTYKIASDVVVDGNKAYVNTPAYRIYYEVIFNTGVDAIVYDRGKLIHPVYGLLHDYSTGPRTALSSSPDMILNEGNGRIWLANTYGLHMLTIARDNFRKYFYQDAETFTGNSYRNIVVDKNRIYAANEFRGIWQTTTEAQPDEGSQALPLKGIGYYALTKTREGTLTGLQNSQLFQRKPQHRQWTVSILEEGLHKIRAFWKIYEITPDSFLLGTARGLQWFNAATLRRSSFSKYNQYTELAGATVFDIIPDDDGQVWLCSSSGLYTYDAARGITGRYSSADIGMHYLPAKEFHHYHRDVAGIYWLATSAGLIRWEREQSRYRLYTRKDGLSNNTIYAVYEDRKNRLWMSSDYGIMQFSKASGNVITYLTNDGITNNEFNRASHTMDSLGHIYFGSLNGITAFNPDDFPDEPGQSRQAPLVISSFEQFNGATNKLEDRTASLVHTGKITLMPGDRFFNITFALQSYRDIMHTTYYWKIEGMDQDWVSMAEPALRFSGLPYGKRILHIKAQASDGSWSRNELRIAVDIIRPVYLRTWFIVLAILLLTAGLIALYRWRVYRLKKENERLDKMVKEKTVTLEETVQHLELSSRQKDVLMKEIHHRVKNNLQIISTLLNLQAARIEDRKARIALEEGIARISSIALIHQHLYAGRDLAAIEIAAFTRELEQQVASVYQEAGQIVVLHNLIPETWLDMDTALPLGLMLNELMTNSYKYAYSRMAQGRMDIRLTYTGGLFTLAYCDHGPGLPDNYDVAGTRSLGMTILKNLSRQLSGACHYSRKDNCFIITFKDAASRKTIA